MKRSARGDGQVVRADGLAISEKNRDCHMCVTIAGIEDASGLVRDERAMRERAFGGNVSLRDGPSPPTDRFHAMTPFFPLRLPTLVASLRFPPGNFLSADCIMREAQNAVAKRRRRNVRAGGVNSVSPVVKSWPLIETRAVD
jgi:hypothetical protein